MSGSQRKRHSNGVIVIFVTAIVCLNVIGINYAQWNNDIELSTSLYSGKMKPSFSKNLKLDNVHGEGKLRIKLDKKDTIKIKGEIEPGYKADLKYAVINNGSIPFKYIGENIELQEGLELNLNQRNCIFHPDKDLINGEGKSKLQIEAEEPGNYDFEIELLFKQWNN